MIAGGVAFAVPDGADPGGPVKSNAEFQLFASLKGTTEQSYQHYVQYVVRFDQSLRGRRPGSPVEYRGIRIGTVDHSLYEDLFSRQIRTDDTRAGQKLPVLIRIEPDRLGIGDTEAGVSKMRDIIKAGVAAGMRATLNSGNLLTGALYVGVDFYPKEEPVSMGEYAGYPTVPTLSSGIARIEKQIGDLLERLNALPLDATVANLNDTLEQAAGALDAVRRLAGSSGTQALPGQLDGTLKELRRTIESFSSDAELYANLERTTSELNRTLQQLQDLAQKLEDQPNSIIFSSKTKPDPEPRATP